MKNSILYLLFILTLFTACQESDSDVLATDPDQITSVNRTNSTNSIGYDFAKIGHWEKSYVNGLYRDNYQFINKTHLVEQLNAPGISAKHWKFKSPSMDGQEIGFSIVKEAACENTPCDVVLYLHGNTGSENAGVSLYNNYLNVYRNSTQGKVFIFANGVRRGAASGSSWKHEAFDEDTYLDPQKLIKELIGGIVADEDEQFGYMKKDMASWSAVGFSAGSNAAVGLYLNPLFYEAPNHQPQTIFSLAGWMSNHFKYFPIATSQLTGCGNTAVKYLVALHDQDDVNCVGNTVYSQASEIIDPLTDSDLPFTALGLSKDAAPCSASNPGSNPSHKPVFYLNHDLDDADHIREAIFNCHNGTFLQNFDYLGNVLYD